MMIRQFRLKRIFLLWIGILPLYGNIDTQIDAIRDAPVSERFKLMNAFKKDVINMHEKERIIAISKLRSITQSKHSGRVLEELHDNAKVTYQHNVRRRPMIDVEKESKIEEDIENTTEDNIESQVEDNIENTTEDNIESVVEDSIENETEDNIESQVEDNIENTTEDNIESEVEDSIENETEDNIESEVEDNIENETEDNIENETDDNIENEVEDNIEDEHEDDD